MSAFRTTDPMPALDAFDDEVDDPIGEWTLDELDDSVDIASLRSAWSATDGIDE